MSTLRTLHVGGVSLRVWGIYFGVLILLFLFFVLIAQFANRSQRGEEPATVDGVQVGRELFDYDDRVACRLHESTRLASAHTFSDPQSS